MGHILQICSSSSGCRSSTRPRPLPSAAADDDKRSSPSNDLNGDDGVGHFDIFDNFNDGRSMPPSL